MSDIRYNGWLHRSGTGGVWQDSSGRVGIGTSVGMNCLINSGPNALTFGTGATPAERVRIDSSGLVAIGHDTPSSWSSGANNLVVNDAAGAGGITIVTPNNAMGSIFFADSTSATGQGRIRYDHNGDYMTLNTNATERLRINSSGQVLVNSTTDPYDSRSLTVGLVPGQSNNYISIIGATNGVSGLTFGDALGEAAGNYAGMFEYYHNGDYLTYKQNGSEKLRLTSSGELLLGTTTAQGNANANDLVVATTGTTGITIRSGTSGNGNLFFADGTSSSDEYRGWLTYDHSSDNLTFGTSAGERIRVTNIGQVLIGTATAPAFTNRQFAVSSSSGTTAIEIRSATNGDGRIIFTDSTNSGDTGSYKGQIMYDQTNDYMQFQTNGSNERFRITDNGVTFKGDSAAANALDDYEEGSWTPAPDDLTNTPQYHNKVGIYTKIGNLVYVMGFIQFGSSPRPTFSNTANQLYVSGLPFPCNAGAGYVSAVGHVTYQSMNWSGGTYNDYGADVKLICTATSSSKVQFRVDGGNNTIRGTLRKAAWHDKDFIVTWSMWYRTTS